MKKILGCLRRGVEDFNMIEEGDKIAVGVSGGKDSLILLKALKLYKYMSPVNYEIEAITLDLGYFENKTGDIPSSAKYNNPAKDTENKDWSHIKKFCAEMDIPYTIKHTNIAAVVFDVRKEKNPCSLCANLRRGALHNAALERGINKVALGHHREDIIETLFLSMFYEGRFNTFKPVTYLDRKDITLIRPLIYAPEGDIEKAAKRHNIPVKSNPCPEDGKSKRNYIKNLLKDISWDIPNVYEQMLTVIKKSF